MYVSNLGHTTRFWKNLHRVVKKIGKPNNLKVIGSNPKGLNTIAKLR